LRFAKRQRDQHRHESTECIDANHVAQQDHDKSTNRDHEQHAVNRLGLDRQAVQRKVDHRRAFPRNLSFGNCNSVEMIFLDRKPHLNITATGNVNHRFVTTPPDQEMFGQIFIPCQRIKVTPAIAVMHLKPCYRVNTA
jgi:hypothetical protein